MSNRAAVLARLAEKHTRQWTEETRHVLCATCEHPPFWHREDPEHRRLHPSTPTRAHGCVHPDGCTCRALTRTQEG